jgi:O-methyltransferase
MIKGALIGVGNIEGMCNARRLGAHAFPGAYTMIGYERLCNIEKLVRDTVANDIPGDLIETGVWKGGAVIYMKYLLDQLGSQKRVYVADSFEGLPEPNPEYYPHDSGDRHYQVDFLRVTEQEVRAHFEKFELLDDRVVFVKGWFKDTLPLLEGPFSVIRLDGDMYESTINALDSLYSKLSPGGYCIVDDYNLAGCQQAMMDFRERENIIAPIVYIDGSGIYWQKE